MKIRVMVCFRWVSQSHSPGCIVIHHARIHQARFWRFSGWFVTGFTVLPSETRTACLSGARNDALW
ncbi:TPA: hypothetical protein ACNV5N_005017 [Citrobacter freundii]